MYATVYTAATALEIAEALRDAANLSIEQNRNVYLREMGNTLVETRRVEFDSDFDYLIRPYETTHNDGMVAFPSECPSQL